MFARNKKKKNKSPASTNATDSIENQSLPSSPRKGSKVNKTLKKPHSEKKDSAKVKEKKTKSGSSPASRQTSGEKVSGKIKTLQKQNSKDIASKQKSKKEKVNKGVKEKHKESPRTLSPSNSDSQPDQKTKSPKQKLWSKKNNKNEKVNTKLPTSRSASPSTSGDEKVIKNKTKTQQKSSNEQKNTSQEKGKQSVQKDNITKTYMKESDKAKDNTTSQNSTSSTPSSSGDEALLIKSKPYLEQKGNIKKNKGKQKSKENDNKKDASPASLSASGDEVLLTQKNSKPQIKKHTKEKQYQTINTSKLKDTIHAESSATTPSTSSDQEVTIIKNEPKSQQKPKEEKIIRKNEINDRPKADNKTSDNKITYKDSSWSGRPNTKKYDRLETKLSIDENNILDRKESIHLPKLQPAEAQFLELVTDDNVNALKTFLQKHKDLNINCFNFQGVSALHLAIQNRSEAMVEFLLQQQIEIGDNVLHAVRDNHLKILVMLLDAQKNISPGLEFAGATHSTDFPDHVTPIILAAQEGHYEAVALLVSRGHTIARPHPPNCPCQDCKDSLANDDPLDVCSSRLSIYRAISSPAYLVHVSSDPILSAFRLTSELADNAGAYRQLAAAYLQLRDDVSAFAVDLIGCCRTSEEVEIILKESTGSRGRRHFVLPRLLMAVDYKQKEFVAHPNTQQVLEAYWSGNWYSWRSKQTLTKAWIVLSRVFITPLILVMCMINPRNSRVQHWQIPLNKLITHAAAYFMFLAIIFIISNQDKTDEFRGPPNTGAEPVLVLYVLGYIWSAVRMCVMQGPRRYFSELWNWGEIIMLFLFSLTFIFWIAATIDVEIHDQINLERKYWSQYDPTLLAEGTFCLATIFAYFRLLFLCQLNYHLGPLQVSLGKMTVDIYKYITVFAIIICSFAAGLARFYQYYDGMVYEDEFGMKTVQVSSFTSLTDTLNTLFWALFCMAPLESADVIIENSPDPKHPDKKVENRHVFTERVGYFCFACFEVISVIVVLNMLIATMSNTFQRVTDNVAIEWTFGRTEVYVEYISQTTLPPPYNMIPTATGMGSIIEWLRAIIHRQPGVYARWSLSYCCYIERDLEANIEKDYPVLMSVLVQRYFRDKESALTSGTGIEGELEALRREFIYLKNAIEKQM